MKMKMEMALTSESEPEIVTVGNLFEEPGLHRDFVRFVGHYYRQLSGLSVFRDAHGNGLRIRVAGEQKKHEVELDYWSDARGRELVSSTSVAIRHPWEVMPLLVIFNAAVEDRNFSLQLTSAAPFVLKGCQLVDEKCDEHMFYNLIIELAQVAELLEASA